MKALRQIRMSRAVKYVVLTIALLVYKVLCFHPLRILFLRFLGARIGRNVILENVRFINYDRRGFSGLTIGDDSYLGDGVVLDLAEAITLGSQVTIALDAVVLTHLNVGYSDHPLQPHFPSQAKPTFIGNGAFIGARAIILPGSTVGSCAFVAAGSVVRDNIPDRVLAAGSPARVVRPVDQR